MSAWDDIGQFIQNAEAEVARLQQQQNGLNLGNNGNSSGGGFHLSPEELQSLLAQWQDLDQTLSEALQGVQQVPSSVAAPANDQASQAAANAVGNSMSAYATHLMAMHKYATNYVQTLNTALQNYQAAESGNRGSAANVHTNLQA